MTTTAKQTAGLELILMRPVAMRAREHVQLAVAMWRGLRNVAKRGIATMASGIAIHRGDAGCEEDPSHQMGRPIVRLVMATARRAPKTPAHVIVETVRQPSLVTPALGVGGVAKSMTLTVLSQPPWSVAPLDSLDRYGKVTIQ